jgi:hypothetical protein
MYHRLVLSVFFAGGLRALAFGLPGSQVCDFCNRIGIGRTGVPAFLINWEIMRRIAGAAGPQ